MNKLFNLSPVSLNVLALSVANVQRLQEITDNKIVVAVVSKDYEDDAELINFVDELHRRDAIVSLGLGGGDPALGERVTRLALKSKPEHVNQVFPLAAYTQGLLAGSGLKAVVNALVAPGPSDGTVVISTGARTSKLAPVVVPCMEAAEMMAEMKIQAVKYFPLGDRLENMINLARSCAQVGIPIFEPTGGIDAGSVGKIVEKCLKAGVEVVIPHIYTSLVQDNATDYGQFISIWNTIKGL